MSIASDPSSYDAIGIACSLQGYNQVTAASLLSSLQALLEIGTSVAVFVAGFSPRENYLRNVGLCTIFAAFLSACAGEPCYCNCMASATNASSRLLDKCYMIIVLSCRVPALFTLTGGGNVNTPPLCPRCTSCAYAKVAMLCCKTLYSHLYIVTQTGFSISNLGGLGSS